MIRFFFFFRLNINGSLFVEASLLQFGFESCPKRRCALFSQGRFMRITGKLLSGLDRFVEGIVSYG